MQPQKQFLFIPLSDSLSLGSESSLSLQDGFRVVFMASRESCPINCAKVYFLSNYYSLDARTSYYHLTFNKRYVVFGLKMQAAKPTYFYVSKYVYMRHALQTRLWAKKTYPICWKFPPVKEKKTLT